MSIDARNLLVFSPLQGEFAAREAKEDAKDLQTILFFDNGKIYKRSTAVVRILTQLGGVWSIARIFLLFPSILRDTVYRWIANNRYKWFGKSDACRLPTKEEREKFLD
jgi:predicted DCC family thiol-disulfide oxidoreductase YuxK